MAPGPGLLLLLGLLGLAVLPELLGAAPGSSSPEVRCVSPAPSLAWLREKKEEEEEEGRPRGAVLRGARRLERRLSNCSSAASVLLEVQVQPELLQMEEEAEAEEAEGSGGSPSSGLVLVLLVLVEARPPAQIAWMAPDGRRLAEASSSRFLLAGDRTFAWPPEGPLRLGLRLGLSNASLGRIAGEEGLPGPTASLPPPASGLLWGRVELPLAALVGGSAGALGAFLGLASLLSCLLCRRTGRRKAHAGAPFFPVPGPPREPSSSPKARMPGPSLSLPADLRLHGFPAAATEAPRGPAPREEEEEEERALSEPERSLGLVQPGLGRFPMVGYIYRASSMSSDEIWL